MPERFADLGGDYVGISKGCMLEGEGGCVWGQGGIWADMLIGIHDQHTEPMLYHIVDPEMMHANSLAPQLPSTTQRAMLLADQRSHT